MQIARLVVALATLLAWSVGMAAPLTPDGLALLDFKRGLTVLSPLLVSWNASDASPCSWGGITCTDGGRVRNVTLSAQAPMLEGNISASLGKLNLLEGLMLDQNLLSGSIPPELGNLHSLSTLVLSNNGLTGQIPPQLGNSSSLVRLWLDTNRLSGDIPESLGNLKSLGSLNLCCNLLAGVLSRDLQLSFAAMTNLSHFDIWNNSISGSEPPMVYKNLALAYYDISFNNFSGDITRALDGLSKLPAIEIVGMEANRFTGTLPPSIGNATTLSYLSVGLSDIPLHRDTGVGGRIPKEIGKLVNLVTLYLGNDNFTGDVPLELWNMTSLQNVDLGQTYIRGQIPPEISNAKSLKRLFLRHDKLINGTIPSSMGTLVNLTYLDLANNSLTGAIPSSFTSLTNLRSMYLDKNNMSGTIPTNFSKTLTSLENILMFNNSFSGIIPSDFGRFMPNFNQLAITWNSFHGTLPDGLCQSGKLEWLTVEGNNLQGPIPSSLASCQSVIHVNFADNQFTSIPDGFGSNSSLQYLNCARNQMTGQIPMRLGANSSLAYLDLSGNRFTGDVSVLEFSQLASNLAVLNLAKNNFTGRIPAAIAVCKKLFYVDMSSNALSGSVPSALEYLSSLQELHLQGNHFTSLHPSIYLRLSGKLRILNLAENPWNAAIAVEIGSLTNLNILNMSNGGYTGPIPQSLGQLTQLEILDFSYNHLTGEIPIELGELMISLTSINLAFNHLTGSLPPAWVKFLLADPASFRGNLGLCLQYDANNVCRAKLSKGLGTKYRLTVKIVVYMVLVLVLVLALVVGLVVFVATHFWRRGLVQKETPKMSTPEEEESEVSNLTSERWMFTYEDIMKATENLSNKYIIGSGGHGKVYKVDCTVETRPSIVVKKIEFKDEKIQVLLHKSFWSEVKTVGKARHRNLVRLLGFIKRDDIGLLLYDYVSNGDLHSALHTTKLGLKSRLNWKARLHIARGIAHGLAYLHHDYGASIVHRDIKSSNVLLDDDLEAHISDFGLAKVLGVQHSETKSRLSTQNVFGTLGYIAPGNIVVNLACLEYLVTATMMWIVEAHVPGHLGIELWMHVVAEAAFGVVATPHADVYSFGVVLLELLTGKEVANDVSYHGSKESHVVAWVKSVVELNKGKMSEFVLDPLLLQSNDLTGIADMLFVLEVALRCTLETPGERPTMRGVENMLKTLSHRIATKNGDEEENMVKSKSNKRHKEGYNGNEDDHWDGIMLNNWNRAVTKSFCMHKESCKENGHDNCDKSMLNVWNLTVSSGGSEEKESFWFDD